MPLLTCNSNMDIAMKQMTNAKERDFDDWMNLFGMADPRFRVQSPREPAGAKLAIIEAAWEGDTQY